MDSTNRLFDNCYKLIEKLGMGSNGSVYSAIDTRIDRTVVLKLARYSLEREAEMYKLLCRNGPITGVPKMIKYVNKEKEYIVMEKLGGSIQHYWWYCGKRFSLKTIVMLGIQMMSRLESLHSCGIVHGDIKEDNFVMDKVCQTLYLIDFGESRYYIDPTTGRHIAEQRDEVLRAPLPGASTSTRNNLRARLSRRDDIESVSYLLLRLFKGYLPWEYKNFRGWAFGDKFDKESSRKMNDWTDTLCNGLPDQFKQILTYVQELRFERRPDYAHLQGLLRSSLRDQDLKIDNVYDWMAKQHNRR